MQCCSNFCCIVTFISVILNCWLILPPCCKTPWKMLVFDTISYSPLPWYFYLAVHYTASPPGCLVAPPGAPLRLYLALGVETPNIDLFLANSPLYRRRCRIKIGTAWKRCPGTLPEGGTPSGRPSIAMDASRMCRE